MTPDVFKANGWNSQCMIKLLKPFSYNQTLSPRGYLPLPPYTCIKLCNFSMSSQKPLEQFSTDFAWGLMLKGYCQFVRIVPHHWTRWLSCPYMVKHLKIFSRTKKALRLSLGWVLVYSIKDSRSTKFVQMMVVGWPFYGKVKFVPPYICMGKMLKSLSQNVLKTNGWNLQCMIKVKLFNYYQNCVPWGLSAFAPGIYTCMKFCKFCISSLKPVEQFLQI